MEALLIAGMSSLQADTALAVSARPHAPVVVDAESAPSWRRTRSAVATTLQHAAYAVAPRSTSGRVTGHRRLAH